MVQDKKSQGKVGRGERYEKKKMVIYISIYVFFCFAAANQSHGNGK